MNCLILLLLLCCCGNNGGHCDCRDRRDRDNDCGCRSDRSDSRLDSRPFISFAGQGTCGCEGSQKND